MISSCCNNILRTCISFSSKEQDKTNLFGKREFKKKNIRAVKLFLNKAIFIILERNTTSLSIKIHIGIAAFLLLEYAQNCKALITSDSKLSDYAAAYGIPV